MPEKKICTESSAQLEIISTWAPKTVLNMINNSNTILYGILTYLTIIYFSGCAGRVVEKK
ncbi:hypothetical protein PP707_03880 [Acetobacter pasteurianus]|nr:hypothetical protein [Acetobacter pasteurianus]